MIKQQFICIEDNFDFYVTDLPVIPRLDEFVDVAGFMPIDTDELKERKEFYDETIFWVQSIHHCKNGDTGEYFVQVYLIDDSKTPRKRVNGFG